MKLQNKFSIPVAPDEAWRVLLDVPRIVSCVPGAELVAQEGDGTYKGRIGVKLGPVALKFLGTVTFSEVDEAGRTAVINAKGSDQQGRGNAGAVTRLQVLAEDGGSTVLLETDMQLSGLVAQYGRASGVIAAVSNEMTAQFANALRLQLTNDNRAQAAAAPVASEAVPAAHAGPGATPPVAPAPVQSVSLLTILWRALLTQLGLRRAA